MLHVVLIIREGRMSETLLRVQLRIARLRMFLASFIVMRPNSVDVAMFIFELFLFTLQFSILLNFFNELYDFDRLNLINGDISSEIVLLALKCAERRVKMYRSMSSFSIKNSISGLFPNVTGSIENFLRFPSNTSF